MAILLKGVSKSCKQRPLLEDIHLSVPAGTYLGLLGRNGAGKTTLIKAMLDLIALDRGVIELFGIAHTDPRSRACLAFLPERFLPPYYLRGGDFLHYMMDLYGQQYSQSRVNEMLNIFDLERSALKKSVQKLSKGMAQKLGLMACLLSGRRLLVLDEPMSGLDLRVRARVRQYLIDLKADGMSLFFSTHLLADLEYFCDQVVIMDSACVCCQGSPEEICSRYHVTQLEQAYLASIDEAAPVPQ